MDICDVAVLGAGPAGIAMAAALRSHGFTNFTVLEARDRAGGSLNAEIYPGQPSVDHLNARSPYSHESAGHQIATWTTAGLQSAITRRDLDSRIHYSHRVTAATFNQQTSVWEISIADRDPLRARMVVVATGDPTASIAPPIPGLTQFDGPVLNTADWDATVDLQGRSVAVIGAGTDVVHVVAPLTNLAQSVTVFDRTPSWVLPHPRGLARRAADLPRGRRALANLDFWSTPRAARAIEWAAQRHLHRHVADPWIRRLLTPEYAPGLSPITFSDTYYPALTRPHCRLVGWPIGSIGTGTVRSSDALTHRVDCLVIASERRKTITALPFPVLGSLPTVELGDELAAGTPAFNGVQVTGFPNLFLLPGPGSATWFDEPSTLTALTQHIVDLVRLTARQRAASIDITLHAVREQQRRHIRAHSLDLYDQDAPTWQRGPHDTARQYYPGSFTDFQRQLRRIHSSHYQLTPATLHSPVAVPV